MRTARVAGLAASLGGALLSAGLVFGQARASDRVDINLGSDTPPVVATVAGGLNTVCGAVDATPVGQTAQSLSGLPVEAPCTPWSDNGIQGYNVIDGVQTFQGSRGCTAIFIGIGFALPSAFLSNGGC